MNTLSRLKPDGSQQFDHLANAPIVEAVIGWTARSAHPLDMNAISQSLAQKLPDYPNFKRQHTISLELVADEDKSETSRTAEWTGFKFSNAESTQIAQFKRDGLTFSRLKPYQNWEPFEAEARRLWRIFTEIADPQQVERLGVRFINRIPVNSMADVSKVLREPPTQPLNLPIANFLYQSRFDVHESGLGVNITKALDVTSLAEKIGPALILDIDVFTKNPFICDESRLDEYLSRMRYLKNGAFFSLLTDAALADFKEVKP